MSDLNKLIEHVRGDPGQQPRRPQLEPELVTSRAPLPDQYRDRDRREDQMRVWVALAAGYARNPVLTTALQAASELKVTCDRPAGPPRRPIVHLVPHIGLRHERRHFLAFSG
jgi:hypothetical protein